MSINIEIDTELLEPILKRQLQNYTIRFLETYDLPIDIREEIKELIFSRTKEIILNYTQSEEFKDKVIAKFSRRLINSVVDEVVEEHLK